MGPHVTGMLRAVPVTWPALSTFIYDFYLRGEDLEKHRKAPGR